MNAARDDIFTRLRGTLDAGGGRAQRRAQAKERMDHPPRVRPPGRVRDIDLVDAFCARTAEAGASIARISSADALGTAVADYLRTHNLPTAVKASPELAGWPVDWPEILDVTHGGAVPEDLVGLAAARVGVAETGTLVMASGRTSPTKLNFLPETHIVVLDAARILATYEQAWDRLRRDSGAPLLPRVVNWITGPSRTADIEQTLLIGVHGPKRLHIVIVEEGIGGEGAP